MVLPLRRPRDDGPVRPRVLRQVRGVPARPEHQHHRVARLLGRDRLRHPVRALRRPLRKQHVRAQQHLPLLHHVQGGRALARARRPVGVTRLVRVSNRFLSDLVRVSNRFLSEFHLRGVHQPLVQTLLLVIRSCLVRILDQSGQAVDVLQLHFPRILVQMVVCDRRDRSVPFYPLVAHSFSVLDLEIKYALEAV